MPIMHIQIKHFRKGDAYTISWNIYDIKPQVHVRKEQYNSNFIFEIGIAEILMRN